MSIAIGGSVAYDYLMKVEGLFDEVILPNQLSQLTVNLVAPSVQKSFGGSAANVAYTLGLFEMHPILLSTVGNDFTEYAHHLHAVGVDLRHVLHFENLLTASYYAAVDQAENRIATFVKGATIYIEHTSFRSIPSVEWVLIVPAEIPAMRKWVEECITDQRPYFYDPSHQVWYLPTDELQRALHHSAGVFVNDSEVDCLLRRMGWTLDDLREQCPLLVVTHTEQGSHLYQGEVTHFIPAVPSPSVRNGTGAGDAYRAGFLAGLMMGETLEVVGRMASLSATYCVEQVGTQEHHFTWVEFAIRFQQAFPDIPLPPSWVA